MTRSPDACWDWFVCWSLTSRCHSNGQIETMPAQEINPFTALPRIWSQFLKTQWRTIISEWTRLRLIGLATRCLLGGPKLHFIKTKCLFNTEMYCNVPSPQVYWSYYTDLPAGKPWQEPRAVSVKANGPIQHQTGPRLPCFLDTTSIPASDLKYSKRCSY